MKKKGNLIFLNSFSYFDFFGKNVITSERCTSNLLRKIKKLFDKSINILQFSFNNNQISSTQFRTGLLKDDQIRKEIYEEFIKQLISRQIQTLENTFGNLYSILSIWSLEKGIFLCQSMKLRKSNLIRTRHILLFLQP